MIQLKPLALLQRTISPKAIPPSDQWNDHHDFQLLIKMMEMQSTQAQANLTMMMGVNEENNIKF